MGGERSNDGLDAAIRARIEVLGKRRLVDELLADGESVVYMDGDDIVREHPDGTREVIGRLGANKGHGERS